MNSNSRNIFHSGNKQAVDDFRDKLAAICGSAQLRHFVFDTSLDGDGETYFNVDAEIAGKTKELVVIGAHLDSTAANDPHPYDATKSAAPGADDNGSGVFGVLKAAEVLVALARQKKPKRTIRFVLFNAEEYWMRGSKAYARDLKEPEGQLDASSVVAMIAMDMIGWRRPGSWTFEIHGADAALAAVLVSAASQVSANRMVAQLYPVAGCSEDPMIERSDHLPFRLQGWPACVVSEDMWEDVCRGKQTGNPDYHKASDLSIDFDYAAEIARAVAAAAWLIADQ